MQYTTIGNFLVVDIHKPLSVHSDYEFCRVWKDYFDKARKQGKYVLVRSPKGERVFMPKSMKHTKTVKETFLFPDRPMVLYECIIPTVQKKPDEYYQFAC